MSVAKWFYRGGHPKRVGGALRLRHCPDLRAYRRRAPAARPHIPMDKDAPLSQFEQVAARYPVFRVVSRGDEGGSFPAAG
jgi:hypothetical protein